MLSETLTWICPLKVRKPFLFQITELYFIIWYFLSLTVAKYLRTSNHDHIVLKIPLVISYLIYNFSRFYFLFLVFFLLFSVRHINLLDFEFRWFWWMYHMSYIISFINLRRFLFSGSIRIICIFMSILFAFIFSFVNDNDSFPLLCSWQTWDLLRPHFLLGNLSIFNFDSITC